MGKKARKTATSDSIQGELDSIKGLVMLLLYKAGATQEEIAMAMGVDQSIVSRLLPARKVKRFEQRQ